MVVVFGGDEYGVNDGLGVDEAVEYGLELLNEIAVILHRISEPMVVGMETHITSPAVTRQSGLLISLREDGLYERRVSTS